MGGLVSDLYVVREHKFDRQYASVAVWWTFNIWGITVHLFTATFSYCYIFLPTDMTHITHLSYHYCSNNLHSQDPSHIHLLCELLGPCVPADIWDPPFKKEVTDIGLNCRNVSSSRSSKDYLTVSDCPVFVVQYNTYNIMEINPMSLTPLLKGWMFLMLYIMLLLILWVLQTILTFMILR